MSANISLTRVVCPGGGEIERSGPEIMFKFPRSSYAPNKRLVGVFLDLVHFVQKSSDIKLAVKGICSKTKRKIESGHLETQLVNLKNAYYGERIVKMIPLSEDIDSPCVITEKTVRGLNRFVLRRVPSIDDRVPTILIYPVSTEDMPEQSLLAEPSAMSIVEFSSFALGFDWCTKIAQNAAVSINDIYREGTR